MKKAINMKNICAASEYVEKAQADVKFYKSYSRFPDDLSKAQENLEQAKKAYQDAAAPVRAVLDEVQKRSTARNITSEDILSAIDSIEKTFGLPKTKLDGVQAEIDVHAQRYPNAYKYTPESTQFTLENRRGVWYLTDVCRDTTGRRTHAIIITKFPDATKQAIIDRCTSFN